MIVREEEAKQRLYFIVQLSKRVPPIRGTASQGLGLDSIRSSLYVYTPPFLISLTARHPESLSQKCCFTERNLRSSALILKVNKRWNTLSDLIVYLLRILQRVVLSYPPISSMFLTPKCASKELPDQAPHFILLSYHTVAGDITGDDIKQHLTVYRDSRVGY